MTTPLKRKHVVFDESAGVGGAEPEAPAPSTGIAGVHPSRQAQVPLAKKPKVKSEKKKRYNAKKQRKQREMRAARKASAPKKRDWTGAEGEEREGEESDSESDSEEEKPDAPAPEPAAPTATAPDEPENVSLEEKARLERKAEKAAIRDARRAERQARRAAEREAAKLAAQRAKEKAEKEEEEESEDVEDGEEGKKEEEDAVDSEDEDADRASDAEIPDLPTARSPTPMLEPFPLPRMAPTPSDAVLSRQGLPAGLADAKFIEQSDRLGISDLASALPKGSAGLSSRTQARLADLGITDLFAVQAALLPSLLSLPLVPLPHARLDDFLVSAPTGSGKTLAYAIPIVEVLARRVVPRLRALVVLPTRDLVVQVRETLEALAKGTGLVIGSVTGQHSFAQEQAMLVDNTTPLLGGNSKLDILIATPGRLMDHLANTPNFTLQHLRFLVIDEADRLLTQSFQNWLAQVLAHARPPTKTEPPTEHAAHDAVAASWAQPLGLASGEFEGSERVANTCQKLLFSATLTRDPAKVAALDLASPQYFIVQSSAAPLAAETLGSAFALPASLVEKMLILPPALKPLNLIHILHQFGATPALVFTKSVEAASRLVRLLSFFEDAYVGGKKLVVKGYTRDMGAAERRTLLADMAAGKVDVIVCSDLVARGIDLPTVAHVISYDVPLDMTKYVHRAGRTARAGREGTAWTLVEKQEALHFKGMMKGGGRAAPRKIKVKEEDLAGYQESYGLAMGRLKEVFLA